MPKRTQRAHPEVIELLDDAVEVDAVDPASEYTRSRRRRRTAAAPATLSGATPTSPLVLSPTAGAQAAPAPSEDDALACLICALDGCDRPCLVDKRAGVVHDYCSREHEQLALRQRNSRADWAQQAAAQDIHAVDIDADVQEVEIPAFECQLPGCTAPAHVDYPRGIVHDYCTREHYLLAQGRTLDADADHLPPSAGAYAHGAGGGAISSLFARLGIPRDLMTHAHHSGGGGRAGGHHRNTADAVDIDSMSREEILALSERIGSVKVGLTERQLQNLPLHRYSAARRRGGSTCGD